MNTAKRSLQIKTLGLFLGMLLGSLLVSEAAMAGVVVKCQLPKGRVGKVCIVKTRFGHTGDQVVIKDRSQRLYWKATGKIVRDRGLYSVVVFPDTNEHIASGDYADVSSASKDNLLDWSSAFSNHAFF